MPETMLRAMAKQAEAERERRAKIIHAEGEFNAAAKLVEAAALMATQPMTLQLRYLQTLTEIGVEKNTTIVFPLPMELMNILNRTFNASAGCLCRRNACRLCTISRDCGGAHSRRRSKIPSAIGCTRAAKHINGVRPPTRTLQIVPRGTICLAPMRMEHAPSPPPGVQKPSAQ